MELFVPQSLYGRVLQDVWVVVGEDVEDEVAGVVLERVDVVQEEEGLKFRLIDHPGVRHLKIHLVL